jgi:hypothetical protein
MIFASSKLLHVFFIKNEIIYQTLGVYIMMHISDGCLERKCITKISTPGKAHNDSRSIFFFWTAQSFCVIAEGQTIV